MKETGKRYLIKIMIPFSVVVVFITLLFQGSMYSYFVKTYSGALCDVESDVLEQKSNNLLYLTENIKSLNNSIRLNHIVMKMCYEKELDIYELIEAQTQFDTIRISSDLIHSIYIVNKKAKEIHISSDQINSLATYSNFFDQDIFSHMEDINSFGTYTPVARKITMANGKEIPVLTYFLYDYFIQTKSIDGIIIINVPIDWLEKKIHTKTTEPDPENSRIMVIDDDGSLILDSGGSPFGEKMSDQAFIGEIMERPDAKGNIIRRIEGENYLMTYYRYANLDWTFIGIRAYSHIKKQLQPILAFTVGLSAVIFTAGMFIMGILSKRLADNYGRISRNVKKLEAENRDHMLARRAEFIRGLMQGKENGVKEKMAAKFAGYGMNTRADAGFYLVLFEVDRFRAFCKAYNMDERNRMLGQALDAVEQQFRQICPCDAGILAQNQIAVLCNASEHTDIMSFSGNLTMVFNQINTYLSGENMPGFSAAVSQIGYGYEEIPGLYDEVTELIQYRYIVGHHTLLFPEMLPEKKKGPEPVERKILGGDIINALSKGRGEDVKTSLQQYLNYLGTESPYESKLMVINLLIQVNNTVIDSSVPAAAENFNMEEIIQEIMDSETMDETQQIVLSVFDELVNVQEEKNKCKYELLIREIKDYIGENYREDNLSINLVAEKVGLSIGYLGRLFKKTEGKSVSEYIMSVRLQKAEELLQNSQVSINTIATQVGFVNNSYFYYVFKKAHGVTPNQWRITEEGRRQ